MRLLPFRALRRAGLAIFLALLGLAPAGAQNTCVSNGNGLWSAQASWADCGGDVPDADDTASIQSGHTITIDTNAAAAALTVEGSLVFDNAEARTLTVAGDLTVASGGVLGVAEAGAAVHTLVLGGNLSADGSVLLDGSGDRCDVTFNGDGDRSVSGSGTIVFAGVTLDLGASRGSVLDVQAVITMREGGLSLTDGTFQLASASTTTPFSGGTTIPATAGFALNNPAATVNWGGSGSLDMRGLLQITAGTMTVGAGTGNQLEVRGASALFDLQGGIMNVTGRLIQLSGSTVSVSGGELNLATDGAAGTGSIATFQNRNSVLTLTGGTVHLRNGNGSTSADARALEITASPADVSIEGGRFVLGTGTGTEGDFDVEVTSDSLFNLTLDADTAPVLLHADLTLASNLTLASGTLDRGGHTLRLASTAERTATLTNGNGGIAFHGAAGAVGGAGTTEFQRYYADANDGWRMIGTPASGVPYSSLSGPFHTQGGPWAEHGGGTSNLWRHDDAAQAFNPITGADAPFEPGRGYIFYMYVTDDEGNTELPGTWTVTGSENTEFERTLPYTEGGANAAFVANPFMGNLDFDALQAGATDVGSSYATWDPQGNTGGGNSGYTYYNAPSEVGAAGRYIAPFQGFFVQTTGEGAELVFDYDMKANDQTPAYPGFSPEGPAPHVRFHVEGQGVAEAETYLTFGPEALDGPDPFDVARLGGLADPFVTLWWEDAAGQRLAFDGRSMASGEETYALHVAASAPGAYTLSWPVWHALPPGWSVRLDDLDTGATIDLGAQSEYTFTLDAAPLGRDLRAGAGQPIPRAPAVPFAGGGPRFALTVTDTGIPVELSHLTATADGLGLLVRWATQSETSNAGFGVELRPDREGAAWDEVAFVEGAGTTTEAHAYQRRIEVPAPGAYRLRLRQVDFDGAAAYSREVEAVVGVPGSHALGRVYPNPFRDRAQVSLAVAREQSVALTVYDALGRLVARTEAGRLAAGEAHTLALDARDLASGVYVVRVEGESFSATRRITVVR